MSNLSITHNDWDADAHAPLGQLFVNIARLSRSGLSSKVGAVRSIQDATCRFAEKLLRASVRISVGKDSPLPGKILPRLNNPLPMVPSAAGVRIAINTAHHNSSWVMPTRMAWPASDAYPTLDAIGL